jgi:tRNA A-37 threonylcarbamoyl transferase component Bud32
MRANAEGTWADARIGRVLSGRYRLDGLLGSGGMSAVFAATHIAVGRAVAVKMLRPDLAEDHATVSRFHGEARAAAAVARRGVVEILDFDVDPELGPFLVMERLSGESLRARIERHGVLEAGPAVAVVAPLLRTLAAVHERGIVHRDLKPDNVVLVREEDGTELPKILDFGVSRMGESTGLTRTGALLGTPWFMAPEQARGHRGIDARADLYSVGAILYQALCGKPPYEAETPAHAVALLLTGPPRSIASLRPGLPETLVRVVETAMERDPERRFPSARAMHDALIASAGGVPRTRAMAVVPAAAPVRPPWLRPLALGAVAVIALLAAIVAIVVTRPETSVEPLEPAAHPAPPADQDGARSALWQRLADAEATRSAGRLEEAMRIYGEVAGQNVVEETDEARVAALASIALGDLRADSVRPPVTAAADHAEHVARDRALVAIYGEAMAHYARAAGMYSHLGACAWLHSGVVLERMADVAERSPVPLTVLRGADGSAEGWRRAQRGVMRAYLEQAAEYHRRAAAATHASGAESCVADATVRIASVSERLATARTE